MAIILSGRRVLNVCAGLGIYARSGHPMALFRI